MRPSIVPRLDHLRHLTVHYMDVDAREDAAYLYKWIRRVVSHAPLETLRLVCESEVCGASPTFDPLLEHLYLKHAGTLRALDMLRCFVGKRALKAFCASCVQLEELAVTIAPDTLVSLFAPAPASGELNHVRLIGFVPDVLGGVTQAAHGQVQCSETEGSSAPIAPDG